MERVRITNSSIVLTVALISALIILYYARYVVLIGLLGVGLGVLLIPVLNFMRSKLHFPKALSALLVVLGIFLLATLVLGSIYYLVADQVAELSRRAPEILSSLRGWIMGLFDEHPWLAKQAQKFNIGTYLQQSAFGLFRGLSAGVTLISSAIVVLALGLYTAIDGKHYFSTTVEAFYPEHRERARHIMSECASVLRGWFRAQLLDMAIVGTLTGVALWIVGVDYWAVFGLLTAVLEIIPFVGIFLVVLTTTLITLASDPSNVPWVLGVYTVTQQLEGNIILPMVMRGRAELPVVPLLILMMFLGLYFGLLGFFLAAPFLAVLRVLYIELYLPKINSRSSLGTDYPKHVNATPEWQIPN